jgi:hypothetical protein
MKLQPNPNNWSCLPTAFAMVIDKPVTWFIDKIGHAGAEEPYGVSGLKAGFHEQECIEVMQAEGFACTPIELIPTISPFLDKRDAKPIFFGMGETDNWVRFMRHLRETRGVLVGFYRKPSKPDQVIGHATAWDHQEQMIYDSNLGGRVYKFADMYNYGFTPRCFWKVQRTAHVETRG